ncbi:hypothetical protein RhiJN_24353 [Ceratobasidium sp. AG-Ba]|nr:hypothetical protein RhiJN_24353 [Ceratobasidium sp. AG-Ba]
MPAADPEDQRRAREFERDLRNDVLAGLAHRAMLDWFDSQPKRVRRSLKLIIETAKRDKAALQQRIASDGPPRLPHLSVQVSSTVPCPPALEENPWAKECPEPHRGSPSTSPVPNRLQQRDLSCLKRDGKAWAGIGRRKRRCREFSAIGRTYVRHQSIVSSPPVPVFALDVPPRCLTRPATPPGLREALFSCIGLPRIADGPATYGLNTPVQLPTRPLPPVLPPFDQLEIKPSDLQACGRRVNARFAYVIARGRQAMGSERRDVFKDAVFDVIIAPNATPLVIRQAEVDFISDCSWFYPLPPSIDKVLRALLSKYHANRPTVQRDGI